VIAATRAEPATTALMELSPSLMASRAARDFVSRTCLDWELSHGIASACLIVSEIVTNGVLHAGTPLYLSVARQRRVLRVAVRDSSSKPLRAQSGPELGKRIHGRGLTLVDAVSRAWGVLPTADGGKVVWAALDV
jgi:anti-sigma regulatory factor (Ser/Thr protein kinase)